MSFLQPWAVWFLAGVPLIVLLYMLRLKRRTVTVSTHLFWSRILQESSHRAFFHRLRHLFSLLLNLLIFALVVGALARPIWSGIATEATSTVVLLDVRARMQAVEPDGQTRFDKARTAADRWLRQANPRSHVALLSLSAKADVLMPFTDDAQSLQQRLERVVATDASGDWAAAVRVAEDLLAGRPGKRELIVITDRPEEIEPREPQTAIRVFPVGTSRENVAITRFATRPYPANPETVEVLLEVQNFGARAVTAELELALDARAFEVQKLELAPGQSRVEVFSTVPRFGRGTRGWLTARLTAADALAADNIAYAALPVRPLRRVLLVSAGNSFLEKLLAVDPHTRFQLITPDGWQPSLAEKFEAVIFDRFVPAGFDWKTATGSYFFLGKTPFASGDTPLDRPLISAVAPEHPLTRNVSLQNLSIQKAERLAPPDAAEGWTIATPMQSFEHPLMVAVESGRTRTVALGFDLLESDLPLRVAFPLLISNALTWLEGRTSAMPLSLKVGESLMLTGEQQIATEPLVTPRKELPATTHTPIFQPLHNGFYLLSDRDEQRWLAVNTFNPQESDLRFDGTPQTASETAPIAGVAGPWPAWTWLTIAALVIFTGEWWLFHRRKTE